MAFDACSIAVIIENTDLKDELHDLKKSYADMMPTQIKGKTKKGERQPHPLGEARRVLLFVNFVTHMASSHGIEQTQQATYIQLAKFDAGELERGITEFVPKRNKMHPEFPWLWHLTLSSWGSDRFQGLLSKIIGTEHGGVRIEPSHLQQSQGGKELWNTLPKPTGNN